MRLIGIEEIVRLPMLAADDTFQRSKGRLFTWSKYVYGELNLTTLRVARRQLFQINKLTNTVDLPKTNLGISSVSVIDKHGVAWPVYRNDKIRLNLLDVSARKDCACENNCAHTLCNLIKGYEAVVSVKTDQNPDGSTASFKCVDRKMVDSKGFLIQSSQYPERVYTNGVWTSTVLKTENTKLCQVDVDDNGCVCDTEANVTAVCNAFNFSAAGLPIGGNASTPPDPSVNKWIYYTNTSLSMIAIQCGTIPVCENIYNISEDGDRLIFPANFGFDKVLVRFYEDVDLQNIKVPMLAVPTFVTGLKWYDNRWKDDMASQKLASTYGQLFSRQRQGLFQELNKYRIAELRMLLNAPVYMPSYIREYR